MSQGLLSVGHHYKWQSWVSLLGCFSARWLPWGLVEHLQSACPFDFLIPARAGECWLSMRYSTHKAVIYALVVQGSMVRDHRCCGASVKTFNMHTSWSLGTVRHKDYCHSVGGWVNKCLKFIQGPYSWIAIIQTSMYVCLSCRGTVSTWLFIRIHRISILSLLIKKTKRFI